MTDDPLGPTFERRRVDELLALLELMASGQIEKRLPISEHHDELDAIAYTINVLVGELGWETARVLEAQQARAAELQEAVARAESANASKDVFLRNVSHELRTPIAAMLGFAELLSSDDLSPQDRADLIARLRANGQVLLALVGDLLDLARLEADKIGLSPEPVLVFEVVQEVLASLEVETRRKQLDVRFEMRGDALGTIHTDRARLRQILVNLVANAVKFTDSGAIKISLSLLPAPDAPQWVIDVADTGIGIAPDHHGALFEPFAQADSSILQTYGGTGLGLALSRRLAEQLGGSLILLSSEPGRGTTLRLTLSSLPAEPATVAPVARTHPLHVDNDVRGLRVLLAEDHEHMRVAVSRLLEQAGAHVEIAADGHEAVARARGGDFDVVLMDLRMPHLDGLEATRLLRREGYRTPIVAITADPSAQRRAGALEAGCDDCLSKPFTAGDLATSMRSGVRWARSP